MMLRTVRSIHRFAALLVVSSVAAHWSHAANLSGTITLPTNKPIRATLTLHDLSTPRTLGSRPFDRQFASKPDGTFSLTGIPAGKYRICVDAPNDNILDPGLWSNTQQSWTVDANTNLTGLTLKVEVGTRLTVNVDDPERKLPESKGGSKGSDLSMVVMTNRKRYHPLREAKSGPNGSDHFAIVPFNESLTLITESTTLALKDKNGNRVSGDSQKTPVRVEHGKAPEPVTVSVGKR
jgi:hypothetical protein